MTTPQEPVAHSNGYTRLQIGLHWAVALLILAAYFRSDGMGSYLAKRIREDVSPFVDPPLHSMFGGAVFVLVLIRIFVRLKTGAPQPHGPPLVQFAATWGHRLLYALMLLVPAMGAISWFGKLHDLGHNHAYIANAFMLVVLAHALIAIAHQFYLKDGTLMRMLRTTPKT